MASWEELSRKRASALQRELRKELADGHELAGRDGLMAVAARDDCDDVLFVDKDDPGAAYIVHLTWSGCRETDGFPAATKIDGDEKKEILRMANEADGGHWEWLSGERSQFFLEILSDHLGEEICNELRTEKLIVAAVRSAGDQILAEDTDGSRHFIFDARQPNSERSAIRPVSKKIFDDILAGAVPYQIDLQ